MIIFFLMRLGKTQKFGRKFVYRIYTFCSSKNLTRILLFTFLGMILIKLAQKKISVLCSISG